LQNIAWPPARVYLLAFKQEKRVEVWGANASGPYRRLAASPILAASGTLGPKRREGDRQVPEGLYTLPVLNPNSSYHLSIRVDYPSADDVRHSLVPRNTMGGDIYVHGNQVSIGCIAIGDPAIEEVFCLVAQARPNERRILIAPVDFRDSDAARRLPPPDEPWLRARYASLRATLLRDFASAPAM
jgi:murein L,D-transpeptidase YafK